MIYEITKVHRFVWTFYLKCDKIIRQLQIPVGE